MKKMIGAKLCFLYGAIVEKNTYAPEEKFSPVIFQRVYLKPAFGYLYRLEG